MFRALLCIAFFVFPLSLSAQIKMVFDFENNKDYFSIPYPNDLHRRDDGTVDRSHYPVPKTNPLSKNYRKIADGMDGFGTTESVFIRFDGVIDNNYLPVFTDTVLKDSPVFLVNIDKSSVGYGERVPVDCYFHSRQKGPLKNLLAMCPYPGFVLRENTVYAAVVMKSLSPDLVPSDYIQSLLEGENSGGYLDEKTVSIYKPFAEYLADQDIPKEEVAAATVYTTGDPTKKLRDIISYIDSLPTSELDAPLKPYRDHPSFYALKSSVTAPQFQTGKGSQLVKGGKVFFEPDGKPIVQRYEKIPIVVMVPKGKMPPGGFPLVIYLHGGSNTSDEFLDHIIKSKDNQFTPGEGPARTFAEQSIAGVSSAIVKNPERYTKLGAHSRLAEMPFYNFFRGDVLTANHWQAGADNTLILKMMMEMEVDPGLCPETDAFASSNGKIKFDKSNLSAMGFSMGGTILGSWSAVEPRLKATIPSGGSGHWGLLIRNFSAVPAKQYFFSWVTNGKKDELMDHRWPTISIIQAALEPCDTITYGPHVARRPFPGHEPKNVYLAVGANDFYTKAITQNALAISLGLPIAGEVREKSIVPAIGLLGYGLPHGYPLQLNIPVEGGEKVTGALLQYEPDTWTNEGHNVNYNLSETKHQYGCFLRTLADDGVAVIPAPGDEGTPCE
jgi:hypothetical protein